METGDSIASSIPSTTYYYIYNVFNKEISMTGVRDIQVYSLYTTKSYPYIRRGLDTQLIEEVWPKYLITDYSTFKYFTTPEENAFIQSNYRLVSNMNDVLLYEIKTKRIAPNISPSTQEVSAIIDRNILRASIPYQMVVGKSYTIQVRVTNTGKSFEDLLIKLSAPFGTIYPYDKDEIIHLGQGGTENVNFYITPTKIQYGATNLTASVYRIKSKSSEPSSVEKLDEVTHQISGIRQAFK